MAQRMIQLEASIKEDDTLKNIEQALETTMYDTTDIQKTRKRQRHEEPYETENETERPPTIHETEKETERPPKIHETERPKMIHVKVRKISLEEAEIQNLTGTITVINKKIINAHTKMNYLKELLKSTKEDIHENMLFNNIVAERREKLLMKINK